MKKKGSIASGGQQKQARPSSLPDCAARMGELLAKICSRGYHEHEVFDAFLDVTLRSLIDVPMHLISIFRTGKMAEEHPETLKVFDRVGKKFSSHRKMAFEIFSECFSLLLVSAQDTSERDALGHVYMGFSFPNFRIGQYFTPWPVCELMACMNAPQNPIAYVTKSMLDAMRSYDEAHAIYANALMLASSIIETEDGFIDFMIEKLFPIAYRCGWEPERFIDPACGSFRMALAHAQKYPQWMHDAGFISYHGMDIDYTCCQMGRINEILYGLNGIWVTWYLASLGKSREEFREELRGTDWDPETVKRYKPKDTPQQETRTDERPYEPPYVKTEALPAAPPLPLVQKSIRTMAQQAASMSERVEEAMQPSLFGDGFAATSPAKKRKVGR